MKFRNENIPIAAIYLFNEADSYGRHPIVLSPEQRRAGAVRIPAGLLKKPGKLQVWMIGQHRLGRLKVRKDVRVGVGPKLATILEGNVCRSTAAKVETASAFPHTHDSVQS
ncbi:hypothetical protein [Prosthecobacter sp.]|uniref:hypothetical protein n=1 Tax=Prosthecobacter sp. TaxID=1965333 RepID=UPI00378442B5